ncbi:methyl-accepting chemotaxis protein, partial [Arhodomonas sp. AD133]|uniref:methyl-accepting chemotaxis protein n=1 Tax=Arhodomonas sp. AD133 TaxID=3415009 RepID=UPI003EB9DE26
MRLQDLSLAAKLLLATGAAMTLAVVAAVTLQYRLFGNLLEHRVTDTELPTVLDGVTSEIGRSLDEPLTVTRTMANNAFIREWLSAGEPENDAGAVERHLGNLKSMLGASSVVLASRQTGNYYEDKGVTRTLERDDPDDGWFYGFLASGVEQRLNIDVNINTGVLTLYVNHVIRLDGERIGASGVGYSLADVAATVRDTRVGESGYAFLAGADGAVTVHPDGKKMAGTPVAELPGMTPETADTLLNGEGFRWTSVIDDEGARHIVAARDLPSVGWIALARVPAAELYADLNDAVVWVAALAAAIIAAALLVIGVMVRGMIRPLRRLADTLANLGSDGGDLRTRLDEDRADELGDLARGFNAFAAELQTIVQRVAATGEELQTAVSGVSQQVEQTADWAGEQAGQTDQVATAVNEMGSTVQEIARNTGEVAEKAGTASETAAQGRETVEHSL